jgi:hypothetical protein
MALTLFYPTPSFLKAFEACQDTVLKRDVEGRLKKLEDKFKWTGIKKGLHYYTPDVLVLKIFGEHNSRVVIQRQEFKGVMLYFLRLFFDKSHYAKWRNEVEPIVRSGIWEKMNPLSINDLNAAFESYQQNLSVYQLLFKQQRVCSTSIIPAYMQQDWFFRQLQYKNG